MTGAGESSSAGSGLTVKPLPSVSVHFLGTCSGGGPISSRNCSSLAVDFGNDIWLFDCADGTLGRLQQSPLKMSNVSRIFITHMHADHVMGITWVLTHLTSGIGVSEAQIAKYKAQGIKKKADVNIYGPAGLRKLIRTNLELTSVILGGVYAVHELLHDGYEPSADCEADDLLANEGVGMDLRADAEGVWREVVPEGVGKGGRSWAVRAGPITHRVPALGYILQEPTPRLPLDTATLVPILKDNAAALVALHPLINHPLSLLSQLTSLPPPAPIVLPSGHILRPPAPSGVPPRKIVIFGDCSGGTENPYFQSMCQDPSLLIHECTNAAIPEGIQRGNQGRMVRTKELEHSLVKRGEKEIGALVGGDQITNQGDTHEEAEERDKEQWRARKEEVRKKAIGRGHSTPDEVGAFARDINARRLVVNHFSAMFPSPRYPSSSPYPSLLSPMHPYPFPAPYPPAYTAQPPSPPLPLTSGELHLRLIMNSIAEQINEVWSQAPSPGDDGQPSSSDSAESAERRERAGLRAAVPARDYMILRVPAHDLIPAEVEEMTEHLREAGKVEEQWRQNGGIWVEEGDKDESRRWVGLGQADHEAGA